MKLLRYLHKRHVLITCNRWSEIFLRSNFIPLRGWLHVQFHFGNQKWSEVKLLRYPYKSTCCIHVTGEVKFLFGVISLLSKRPKLYSGLKNTYIAKSLSINPFDHSCGHDVLFLSKFLCSSFLRMLCEFIQIIRWLKVQNRIVSFWRWKRWLCYWTYPWHECASPLAGGRSMPTWSRGYAEQSLRL